jgi:hypothetical protein
MTTIGKRISTVLAFIVFWGLGVNAGEKEWEASFTDATKDVSPDFKIRSKRKQISLTAASGERRGFSIVVRSDSSVNLKCSATALKSSDGKTIPAEKILLRYADYSEKPSYTGHFLHPVPKSGLALRAGKTSWLWGTITVPSNTSPGIYKGAVTFASESGTKILKIKLFVNDLQLTEDKGSWGFFLSTDLKGLENPSYNVNVEHDLSIDNLSAYFAFWKSHKLNSPFLYHVRPHLKLIDGKKVEVTFPTLKSYVKAMRENGLDGDLCIDMRTISTWCQYASDKLSELEKAGKTVPRELVVKASWKWPKKYDNRAKKFYAQIARRLVETAKREKWPTIRLMVSEEVAGAHKTRRKLYNEFMPVLKKIAPEKMIMIDNSVGFGRKDEVDCGERDKFPVRQYNSWTEKALAAAKRDGAKVRSYNYDMFRAAWGFEQWRLGTDGHHTWADQWGLKWIYSRVDERGDVTSSVQYERVMEGRYDYIYCETLMQAIEKLRKAGKETTADRLLKSFKNLIAGMPVGRPGFFFWKDAHTAADLDKMRLFVIKLINDARISLGDKPSSLYSKTAKGTPRVKVESAKKAGSAKSPDSKRILLAPLSESITIDGDLDESSWNSANSTGPLHWMKKKMTELIAVAGSQKDVVKPEPVSVSVAYNSKGLVLGIDAVGPSNYYLLKIGREKGDDNIDMWRDDCVEVFFANPANNEMFHFLVTADGHKTLISATRGLVPTKTTKVTTCTRGDGYKQEVLIPWSLLGMSSPPSPGAVWKFNMGREYHTKDQVTSWGDVYDHYNEVKYWGKVKFTGGAGNLRITTNQAKLFPGDCVVTGTVVSISGSALRKLKVEAATNTGIVLKSRCELKKTSPATANFAVALNIPETKDVSALKLSFKSVDGKNEGKIYVPVEPSGKPFSISTRSNLVETGGELTITAVLRVGNADMSEYSIVGSFSSTKGETLKIPRISPKTAGASVLKVRTSGLHPGQWILTLTLEKKGAVIGKDSLKVDVLPSIDCM